MDSLFAVIRTRDQLLFEGQVKALSSSNEKGVFDIMSGHAQFITLLKDFIRIHKLDGSTQEIKISSAILKAKDNKVNVYVGISTQSTPVQIPQNKQAAAK